MGASIEAVRPDLPDRILIPKLARGADQRDQILDADVAQDILNYLSQFHYASFEHSLTGCLWETGMRIGGCHALDLKDIRLDEEYTAARMTSYAQWNDWLTKPDMTNAFRT